MDINEVTLLGSIKKISEIKTLNNGNQCCWIHILTDISYKKKDGNMGHIQDTHHVIAYGKYAHTIKEKASIDQKIKIKGRIKVKDRVSIVLENFKLQEHIQNNEEENYDQRQDMVDDGPEIEEQLKFNDDEDSFLRFYYETDSLDLLPTENEED